MVNEIDMTENTGRVKVHKASKALQLKAGVGTVDDATISKAEKAIETADIDFVPMAQKNLSALRVALDQFKDPETTLTPTQIRASVTKPVMALKAEGAMFRYDLVGDLANIMLSFLESVSEVDKTVIQILDAHHATLNAVVSKRMTGDGGEGGESLKTELRNAIKRYLDKKQR